MIAKSKKKAKRLNPLEWVNATNASQTNGNIKITITETTLNNIIVEAIKRNLSNSRFMLNESDTRLKYVNKVIDREFNRLLNLEDRVASSEYYVNNNPNTTWREYLLYSLKHEFGLMNNSDTQYLPIVAKLAFSDEVGFEKRNDNGREIYILGKIIQMLKKDENLFAEVNKNRDSVTFGKLYEALKDEIESIEKTNRKIANNVEERNDYDIIWVKDYNMAKRYGDHSCSTSKLCYTQSPNTWNSYTDDGKNKVYVCLRHGWENIPEQPTEGNPYDLYGTSMIFVFINPEGNITTSNCRWNHKAVGKYRNGVDEAFDDVTLCQTVGVRFDSVFKPYTNEELKSMGIKYIAFDEVPVLLAQGVSPKDIFDRAEDFYNGFSRVKLNNKWNYINTEGQLISKYWFDLVGNFNNGFAKVNLNHKYNFINTEGQLISKYWFDDYDDALRYLNSMRNTLN